jgi:acetate kinase
MNSETRVLAINGGSSSIKFAVFSAGDPPQHAALTYSAKMTNFSPARSGRAASSVPP